MAASTRPNQGGLMGRGGTREQSALISAGRKTSIAAVTSMGVGAQKRGAASQSPIGLGIATSADQKIRASRLNSKVLESRHGLREHSGRSGPIVRPPEQQPAIRLIRGGGGESVIHGPENSRVIGSLNHPTTAWLPGTALGEPTTVVRSRWSVDEQDLPVGPGLCLERGEQTRQELVRVEGRNNNQQGRN